MHITQLNSWSAILPHPEQGGSQPASPTDGMDWKGGLTDERTGAWMDEREASANLRQKTLHPLLGSQGRRARADVLEDGYGGRRAC